MLQKYGHMCMMIIIREIKMMMMMITLGMPIQLPDPSDATEQGESGTPELFRSGVLQIGVMMMMVLVILVTVVMMVMVIMVVTQYQLLLSEYSKNGSNPVR